MSLAGKRIVIVGGGSDTGLATAKLVGQMGAELVIAVRSKEKLDKACVDLGCSVEARALDIRREDEVKEFFAAVGDFDRLATPGTSGMRGSVLEFDTQTAREAFDSKFWGQYMAAKYAAPHLRPGGPLFSSRVSTGPVRREECPCSPPSTEGSKGLLARPGCRPCAPEGQRCSPGHARYSPL